MNATDDYIATFPDDVRPILTEVAAALRRALPGAEERIRYDMPAFMLGDRYALHFAGWTKHVGLYPVSPLYDPAVPGSHPGIVGLVMGYASLGEREIEQGVERLASVLATLAQSNSLKLDVSRACVRSHAGPNPR